MSANFRSRRTFLQSAVAGSAALGLGDLGFLSRLKPVSAAESQLPPGKVRLRPEIEPLVQLLEETPRDQVIEEVARHIHRSTSYTEILAALLLAGVRNIQPRPAVGFKFHAVLVVNSAHLASLSSPDSDRWLPVLWAIDEFKSSQARDVQEGNWTMAPVAESSVPAAEKSRDAFIAAMQRWDEPAADAATAALARALRRQRMLRAVRKVRRERFSVDWTQGNLRRQQLADSAVHRLALRRAGPSFAGIRAAQSHGRAESRGK